MNQSGRKAYAAPTLVVYGDARRLTQAANTTGTPDGTNCGGGANCKS